MSFLEESFLLIHVLLAFSSLFIGGNFLLKRPSLKLFLARVLLLSSLLSPFLVSFLDKPREFILVDTVSLDTAYTNTAGDRGNRHELVTVPSVPGVEKIPYRDILYLVFLVGVFVHLLRLRRDIQKIYAILRSSTPYKSVGRSVIQISDQCLIPFSTRFLSKAYIVLPLSMLHSSRNTKIAIAHEGQHHRQGDCLFSYLMECLRIIFWGNFGVSRWHRILNELQELACDEVLVGHQLRSAHDYGHCLYKVAQTVSAYSESCHREIACTVGMAWNLGNKENSFVRRRICMLSQYGLNVSKHTFSRTLLAGLALGVPICTAYAAKGALPRYKEVKIESANLDARIQDIAFREITDAVKRYKARSGAIAVADVKTGKIIAFAESGSDIQSESWSARVFPSASTIKPYLAAAAIEGNLSTEAKVYDCRSPYSIDGEEFYNYDSKFGNLSLTEAMSKSVNVCMIKLAQDLGSSALRETLSDFGFDTKSQWRSDRSNALQLAHAALGRNIPTNIGTLSKAFAVLAHKGHGFDGNSEIISESTAEAVTRMLVDAVERGTGQAASIPGVKVAGKTGTTGSTHSLAMFGGYAPAEKPGFVSVVVIEDGVDAEGNNSGGALAAPVFRAVAEKVLRL